MSVRYGNVMPWRFLLEDISMLVAEGKERPEIWEREVFLMVIRGPNEKKPEMKGEGKVSVSKAGRVMRVKTDIDVRAGTERV
jgi:hypothetical protein